MYPRPDPRIEKLDERLRGIPQGSFHPLLGMISELEAFKGWWRGRYVPAPRHVAARLETTISEGAEAALAIDWSGDVSPGWAALPGPPPRRTPGKSPRASGYARALREVFERHGEMALTEDVVRRLHVVLYIDYPAKLKSHAGRYRVPQDPAPPPRRGLEAIALRPADPVSVPLEMETLVRWTSERLSSSRFHPAFVVAAFVLEFLAIHPFVNGNARLSRVLTNLLLLRSGYAYMPYASLDKAIADRKAEYYVALRKSQASRNSPASDLSPWLRAFLEAMRAQARELRRNLEDLPADSLLSENQRRALELAARHGEVTNRLLVRELGLPRETAKQVLSRLVVLNALERAGSGRSVRYVRPAASRS
jgi:fido (protein-threonine AMPylation protein)